MKIGMIMDPIENIIVEHDTSFAIMLEAERRGWEIYYIKPEQLFLRDAIPYAFSQLIHVKDDESEWVEVQKEKIISLSDLNIIFMRKDPPFDVNYLYATHLLEYAEKAGVLVVNKPQALRDANEKLFAQNFPQCCVSTLVSSQKKPLFEFLQKEKDIIIKPLDGKGGEGVFRVSAEDKNAASLFELLTKLEAVPIMAQRYIPEITQGDKRILLLKGKPVPYALARLPKENEVRANIAAGGRVKAQPLTVRDKWICEQIAPTLVEKGLWFVGIDVIGDYLTEINVTSPTCVRELDQICGLNIIEMLFDAIST